MTDDVFTTETPAPAPTTDLVGPDKKFKTVEDLARGKAEADAYIENLKREQAELRAELAKATKTDEELAALRAELNALRTATPQGSREQTVPALTVDSVKSLVEQTITQAERNRTAQQNVQAANAEMVRVHGTLEKAAEAVKARAAEVGMSLEAIKAIAASSPTAFAKIMGNEQAKSVAPLNPNRVAPERTPSLTPNDTTPGTKAYFDNIQKTDRNAYFSPRVQQEIWKAVKAGTYQLDN